MPEITRRLADTLRILYHRNIESPKLFEVKRHGILAVVKLDKGMEGKMSKGNKKKDSGKRDFKKIVVKKQYVDLYYMNSQDVSAKEIADALKESKPDYAEQIECWEEAGVVEISVGEDSSIDMELLELSQQELEDEFLASNQITCVYSVHTDSQQMQEVKTVFECIVGKFGGLRCSDSADFQPIIVK